MMFVKMRMRFKEIKESYLKYLLELVRLKGVCLVMMKIYLMSKKSGKFLFLSVSVCLMFCIVCKCK